VAASLIRQRIPVEMILRLNRVAASLIRQRIPVEMILMMGMAATTEIDIMKVYEDRN
jgi:hypothetical protein